MKAGRQPHDGLNLWIATPGFPANDLDDQCLPPLQVFWRALPDFLPGASIRVFSLHYPFAAGSRSWRGIPVTDIGGRNRPWPSRLLTLGQALLAMNALAKKQRPSVVHAFLMTDMALVTRGFARAWGVPWIGTIIGQDAQPENRYGRWLRGAARLVAPSDRAAALYRQSFGGVLPEVIPWGVGGVPNQLSGWNDRGIDLLGVGSLTPLKDFSAFVRIAGALSREGLVRRVVLVGDGPERPRIQAMIAQQGLTGVVECRGALSNAKVLELMADARVLLHPSRYEGFGMVFVEARSRGMSLVSKPVGAARPSPGWSLGESEEELLAACRAQLAGARGVGAPPDDCRVEFATRRYAALYAEVRNDLGRRDATPEEAM